MPSKKNSKGNLSKIEANFAFIDVQNVNLAIREQGWKLIDSLTNKRRKLEYKT